MTYAISYHMHQILLSHVITFKYTLRYCYLSIIHLTLPIKKNVLLKHVSVKSNNNIYYTTFFFLTYFELIFTTQLFFLSNLLHNLKTDISDHIIVSDKINVQVHKKK